MACDVTVLDTYAESHIDQTAIEACSAANKAATNTCNFNKFVLPNFQGSAAAQLRCGGNYYT